jgi:hypothetical protein
VLIAATGAARDANVAVFIGPYASTPRR